MLSLINQQFKIRIYNAFKAHIAQEAEHTLGKGEVTGSSPVVGSI